MPIGTRDGGICKGSSAVCEPPLQGSFQCQPFWFRLFARASNSSRPFHMPTRTGGLGRADQGLRVVPYVVLHEGRDEVIVVVVAFMPAQGQRLSRFLAGRFEGPRVELLLQEFVRGSLVHEYRPTIGVGTLAYQLAGVVLAPEFFVGAQVPRKRLLSPRGPHGSRDGGEGRDRGVEVGVL